MALRYGIETEIAAQRPSATAPGVNFTMALIGKMEVGATAAPGELQRETDVPADTKYGATSLITQALDVIEHVESVPVIVVPLDNGGTFADLDGTGAGTAGLREVMLAMTSEASLSLKGLYPELILAPGLFDTDTATNADLTTLKSIAKIMQSFIYTDSKADTATPTVEALAWAANNLVAPAGDFQRVRAACNLFDSAYGSDLPSSILLAAMTAQVQSARLGEDVMNRAIPAATAISPEYSFDTGDVTTQGQNLANHFLTPVVINNGQRVFWGRQGADGDLGDYGYLFVVEAVLRNLKKFFDAYIGRDLPPAELSLLCSIFNARLQSRVNRGELFDAVCIPDPRHGGGTGVDAADNSGYALVALERVPYAGKFSFQIHTGTGAVAAVEGIS